MRLSKRRRAGVPLMNMTPMIDVVFLLLIFFMTVSQVSQINRERLQLPKQKGDSEQQTSVITLNVTEDGRVIVSGSEVSVARVLRIVVDQLDRLGNDPSRLTVVLRADERSDSTTVNQIVTGLAQLQLNRVRIAVEVPERVTESRSMGRIMRSVNVGGAAGAAASSRQKLARFAGSQPL